MLLLSYFIVGFYSNTLINAVTNVPIKSIVLILRQFFISKFSSFLSVRMQHFFLRGLKVPLLLYYLGINQLLISLAKGTTNCHSSTR